ncbi:MAG: prephenate dehydrogenase/arogenate dehydrogenase family protein [Vicinamibacterales bacterium]
MSPPGRPIFARVAIAGCGLIGGSLALAIRRQWPASEVVGIDRREVIQQATHLGAITQGGADLALAAGADLIVLAAPVRQNIDMILRLADVVPGSTLVSDVGSTKVTTAEAAAGLPGRLRFIGGHPLAGAAAGGIDTARANLFDGRTWLVAADAGRDDDDLRRLEAFVGGIGATPRRIAAVEHDRLLADVSHLPQLTASALMHVVGQRVGEAGLALAGRGLRDSTRLAASPPEIWRDVAATNDAAVGAALDDLIAILQSIRNDLGNGTALQQVFDSARRWKHLLDSQQPD